MKPTREDLIRWCRIAEESGQYVLPEIIFLWGLMHFRLIAVNPYSHVGQICISRKEALYVFGGERELCSFSKWIDDYGEYVRIRSTHNFPKKDKLFWLAFQLRLYWSDGESDDFLYLMNIYRYVVYLQKMNFRQDVMAGSERLVDWCRNRFINVLKLLRLQEVIHDGINIIKRTGLSILCPPEIPHQYNHQDFIRFVSRHVLSRNVSYANGTGVDFYNDAKSCFFLHDSSLCRGRAGIVPLCFEAAEGGFRTFCALPVYSEVIHA